MIISYKPKGTCSTQMTIHLDGETIQSVHIEDGCSGNLEGLCRLVQGMAPGDVIAQLEGIHCGRKATSCPDQLAQALKQAHT